MQPLPSWISPLTLQIAPNLKKSPSTERQRRHNPHENEYWQHFQQQGDGAGIPCIASPEMLENAIKNLFARFNYCFKYDAFCKRRFFRVVLPASLKKVAL
jgi:hypothetical protein